MKKIGYAFLLSNEKELLIAPEKGVDTCKIVHKGIEITLNAEHGSFQAKNRRTSGAEALSIVGFRKTEVNIAQSKTVHSLDCTVTGGCCDCGDGWICG